ncbi:MAG: hypothetical protein A2145_05365 [candidate division Zixibacteria bacterium RBG_16_40_9]|nr:MAG: hypothetical protein A2145_05365 [candidate division Zixibacteria bacterium RBG_16_40_9]
MKNLKIICLILISLLFFSCSMKNKQIELIRQDADQLIKAQSEMGYANWTQGAFSNQDSLYKAYEHLFTKENIQLVKQAEEKEKDPQKKKALTYLRLYLLSEYISKQTAALYDQTENMQSQAKIKVEGKEIPFRQIAVLISNEKDQNKRRKLFVSQDSFLDSLNVIYKQIEDFYHSQAQELGYNSYNAFAQDLKSIDLENFKPVVQDFLVKTQIIYETLLTEFLQKNLKLNRNYFYRFDVPALLRQGEFDKYFPKEKLVETVKATYLDLGIDMDKQPNLKIDSEEREKKNPRAVCFAIDVPADVRLSIKPIGGVQDYAALFHESGHGEHFANTTEKIWEFKYLGNNTVTEAYAFLSEYFLSDKDWLSKHTQMSETDLKEFLKAQVFSRLLLVRRYCAKFLYELELHSQNPKSEKIYADYLSQAMGFKRTASDEKRYLYDVDANYYVVDYLRAWFLEAQLKSKLKEKFGESWFEKKEAGAYLKALWENGNKFTGEELVQQIGYPTISSDALINEINQLLSSVQLVAKD